MKYTVEEMIPKLGLIIGIFFCLSPLPTIITALTKDKTAIKSLSLPTTIMGITCTTTILSFCTIKDMTDCIISCYMFLVQGIVILLTIYSIKQDFKTFLFIMAFQVFMSYGVYHLFSHAFTDILMFILNTLSCVLFPLDTLDKLLKTKDIGYVNYLMHTLNSMNAVIWTFYHFNLNSYTLAAANFSGLLCSMIMVIGCLYALGTLNADHPAVRFA